MGPFRTLLNAILRTGAPLFVDTTVTTSRNTTRSILPIIIGVLTLTFAGCQNMVLERADRDTKSERLSKTNFELEVDPIMRGTVASEGIFTGYEPTVVRGYGLVVGLSGTGSRIVPAQVRSLMLAEMTRRGVGDPQNGWNGLTPERMLDSEDTAIVVVEGVIPPGAPKGTEFDVRVFALPRFHDQQSRRRKTLHHRTAPGPACDRFTAGLRAGKGEGTDLHQSVRRTGQINHQRDQCTERSNPRRRKHTEEHAGQTAHGHDQSCEDRHRPTGYQQQFPA